MGNRFSSTRRPSQPTFTTINAAADGVAPIATGVPVATAVAASPASNAVSLALSVSAEKESLAAGSEHTLLTMISLKAPPALDDAQRPPIDLVACIDRSGSMRGEKMTLMKKTLELLVQRAGLKKDDRISLVTFDNTVRLDLPLTAMDTSGRARAERVVGGLQPGSTTNLSGGALQAIDVLEQSGLSKEGRTRAVMIFTDGMANEGIKDPRALQRAVNAALSSASAKVGGPISLYTFGFGADHNEDCLRELATGSGASGLYYYIRAAEDIPNAFADALGGLTSVVAQNVRLTVDALGPGVSVRRLVGSTYRRDTDGTIVLGDLFAEDEKDLLVELAIPKHNGGVPSTEPIAVLRTSVRGFNVPRGAPDDVAVELAISRPEVEPEGQRVNTALDEQRNRILVAEAMEAATRHADAGDVASGRAELERAARCVGASESAGSALSNLLQAQVVELQSHYSSVANYRSVGGKMSKMHAMSHARQRATHQSEGMYTSGAKRKAALKSSWAVSLSKAPDSDSD